MESGRLIDVVNHLPPGTRLRTTAAFEQVVPQLVQGSILQACRLIVDAGLQEAEAVIRGATGSYKEDGEAVEII
jgi:hypothetical protein